MDVARPRAGEEQRQLRDVLRLADTAQAALAQRLGAHLLNCLALRLGELLRELLVALGLRLPGVNDVNIDVVAVAERGEPLGKIRHRRVDRATDQEFRPRRARGAADDVDDIAVRLLEQRPEQPRQPHRGMKLEREAVGPGLVRLLEELAALGGAGTIDQHVAALEALIDACEHLLAGGNLAQIAGDGHRLGAARSGDHFRRFGEIGRARCRQNGLRALARKRHRDGPADAAAAPADDDDFSFEFLRHWRLP